jgi:hypothetical protein
MYDYHPELMNQIHRDRVDRLGGGRNGPRRRGIDNGRPTRPARSIRRGR